MSFKEGDKIKIIFPVASIPTGTVLTYYERSKIFYSEAYCRGYMISACYLDPYILQGKVIYCPNGSLDHLLFKEKKDNL